MACVPATSTVPRAGLNDPNFDACTQNVQCGVRMVMGSGEQYVTSEMCQRLSHIDNGVGLIRLDHKLLDNDEWNRTCGPAITSKHKRAVLGAMCRTGLTLNQVAERMRVEDTYAKEANQIREDHHVTIQELKDTERDLGRLTHESIDRIKTYCNHTGVTDRYTDYRNNLSRGNRDPTTLSFSWLKTSDGPHYSNIRVKDVDDGTYNELRCSRDLSTLGPNCLPDTSQRGCGEYKQPKFPDRTLQARCGIITHFPGPSEYRERYSFTPDTRIIRHTINPEPDYNVHGRYVDKASYTVDKSEYQCRFKYPDGNLLPLFPWLRK